MSYDEVVTWLSQHERELLYGGLGLIALLWIISMVVSASRKRALRKEQARNGALSVELQKAKEKSEGLTQELELANADIADYQAAYRVHLREHARTMEQRDAGGTAIDDLQILVAQQDEAIKSRDGRIAQLSIWLDEARQGHTVPPASAIDEDDGHGYDSSFELTLDGDEA